MEKNRLQLQTNDDEQIILYYINNKKIRIFRIKTTLDDTGNYACHAENKLGKDERNVFLQVYGK